MKQVRQWLFSDSGMKIVNAAFLLSLLFRNSGIIFVAYALWIIYLSFGIRRTSSRTVRAVNTAFILFAAVMISVNLWALLRSI